MIRVRHPRPALILPLTLWACGPHAHDRSQPAPPALTGADVSCQTAGQAAHRARHCQAEAKLRISGYPFSPADGPEAIAWLTEAIACHRAAGDDHARQTAAALREHFAQRVQTDYRIMRLRLDYALAQERPEDAAREARALVSLLSHTAPNAYLSWLRRLHRRLL